MAMAKAAKAKEERLVDINRYEPCFRTEPTATETVQDVDLRIFERIPYFLYRQSFALSDCWGIARMFYAVHGWIFDIDSEHNSDNGAMGALGISHKVKREFEEVQEGELDYGDLVTFGGHVFVFLHHQGARLEVIGQNPLNTEILTASGRFLVESEKLESFSRGKMRCWKRNKQKTCKPYKLTPSDRQIVELNHKYNPFGVNGIMEAYEASDKQTMCFLRWRGYNAEQAEALIAEKKAIDSILNRKASRRNIRKER